MLKLQLKAKHFFIIILLLFSCNKIDYKHNEFTDINVYNEDQIDNFIQFFIKNLNDKNDFSSTVMNVKFYGNKLKKETILLKPEKWIITKAQHNSLFTDDDWIFIKQQIDDKKEYSLHQKISDKKILNSDSLKKENLKFIDWQNKKADSLRLKNIEKFKEYISKEMYTEYGSYIKKSTPILYINKPIFLKNRNRVIFSYYTYTSPLSAYSETAIYEFKNGKWFKIKIIHSSIS